MANKVYDEPLMENVRIIFRNFSGEAGPMNREGDRGFSVLIPDSIAEALEKDGWNVKWLDSRQDDDGEEAMPAQAHLPVAVGYSIKPPRIVMIGDTSKKRTELDESSISVLDAVDIDNVDLVVRPYNWTVGDKSGVKAYVKTMYVTIHEDYLDLKYSGMEPGDTNE